MDAEKKAQVAIVLGLWRNNCARNRMANYLAANRFSRVHTALGITTVTLSALVGTSVFAALRQTVDTRVQILVGVVSLLSACSAALQTFLKYNVRASTHRLLASRYGALVREIEAGLAAGDLSVLSNLLREVRDKMDALAEDAPVLPESIWRRSNREERPVVWPPSPEGQLPGSKFGENNLSNLENDIAQVFNESQGD